ncbi:MAG: hypothetical protein JWQ43_3196 [Glaciihabitans sp.]|nr:hypothetical protein [Glaciihabitans sp.]
MPEMTFTVRWPDGTIEDCYSPSLVMHDHLDVGAAYPVDEFVSRANTALQLASQRVLATYGFECTSAMAQQDRLAISSARYDARSAVTVLDMQPPLPAASALPPAGQ